jgi:hypothetical protein
MSQSTKKRSAASSAAPDPAAKPSQQTAADPKSKKANPDSKQAELGLRMERYDHPWKIVPISLIAFQIRRMLGVPTVGTSTTSGVGLPVNLFDAMRIVLRKSAWPPFLSIWKPATRYVGMTERQAAR